MCLGVNFHIREIERGRERDRGGKGDGGGIRDGGGAGEGHRGCGGWCKGDGGSIRDGWRAGDGWGRREMPGSLGRVCIGLGKDRCGEEGAGDKGNREDQKSQQAFEHRFDCSLI